MANSSAWPSANMLLPSPSAAGLWWLLQWGICGFLIMCLAKVTHNISTHKLAGYPGPKMWGATRLVYVWHLLNGQLHEEIRQLHERYGPMVRIAPDELSFNISPAWSDIYCGGHHNRGFPKHRAYRNPYRMRSLFDAADEHHLRIRRMIQRGLFSPEATRRQERIVQEYGDKLINLLRTYHSRKQQISEPSDRLPPADLFELFTFTSFDIIGRIVMSEDFGCLQGRALHPWIEMVVTHLRLSAVVMCLRLYPWLPTILYHLAPPSLRNLEKSFFGILSDKVGRRQQRILPEGEYDMVSVFSDHSDTTQAEIEANCALFMLAGSETVVTSLISAVNLLCEHPIIMDRLANEVRSVANDESDINFLNTSTQMPYLNAVIREVQRLYPPVPTGPARVTGSETALIAGFVVPPKTAVGVTQYAAHRSAQNFCRPEEFLPERWLSSEEAASYALSAKDQGQFAGDRLEVCRPFAAGGRDCIAQSLALAENRVLLARLVWNFKLDAVPQGSDRTGINVASAFGKRSKAKSYILWAKESYLVNVSDR